MCHFVSLLRWFFCRFGHTFYKQPYSEVFRVTRVSLAADDDVRAADTWRAGHSSQCPSLEHRQTDRQIDGSRSLLHCSVDIGRRDKLWWMCDNERQTYTAEDKDISEVVVESEGLMSANDSREWFLMLEFREKTRQMYGRQSCCALTTPGWISTSVHWKTMRRISGLAALIQHWCVR